MGSRIMRIVAIAAMVTTLFGAARAEAVTTPSTTALSAGEVVVDEAGGHVFVTASDTVAIFDLAGDRTGTIADQLGASDLELHGRTLYVLAGAASRVNTIDADTFAVTGGWNLPGLTKPRSLAVVAGKIWITFGSNYGLASLDPTSGAVQTYSALVYSGADVAGTDAPARLYVLHRGVSPSKVNAFDISTGTPVLLGTSPHTNDCGNGKELALAPSGVDVWTACGAPYQFDRWDRTALAAPTGAYTASFYPAGVTVSGDGNVLVGATSTTVTSPDIWLYDVATMNRLKTIEIGAGKILDGMIATTFDGSRVYAVTDAGVLRTFDLRPTVTQQPAGVVGDTATTVAVNGTGLADVTSVTLGGSVVPFTVVSDTLLRVSAPALDGGTYPLTLSSRWGTSATSGLAQVVVVPRVPEAPAAPTVSGAPAFGVSLQWADPAVDGGAPITSYRLRTYLGDATTPSSEQTLTSTSTSIDGLLAETGYRFSVAAVNAAGVGAFSAPTDLVTAGSPDIAPFTNLSALVDQQYLDLLGRVPTATERASWLAKLRAGDANAVDLVLALRATSDNVNNVNAAARLYQAYYGRPATAAALDYWMAKLRKGTGLSAMSTTLAASAEFKATTGKLTNKQFVTTTYKRLFGRAAKTASVTQWTAQLDQKKKTRAVLMLDWAQSAEYVKA
ncbi:MAG: DUF4214 domain-containing protein, partial [Acidimicrobiia bacterium]|nr:DUF4214 domain-containing protein [Acidimicrobiia bacterium]